MQEPLGSGPLDREGGCRKSKCIALTFDDGPVGHTARLLDVLAEYGARATFFVVGGQVAERPEMVRRQLAEGHEVGNHSYTHANLGHAPPAVVRAEIGRTQDVVERAAGMRPRLFRPPYGATGGTVTQVARKHGLAQILWSVDTLDWRDRDAGLVRRRAVEGARPGRVVLMHDIQPSTLEAVPGILRKLAAEGFMFVTVSELFNGERLAPGRKYTKAP